MDFLNKDIQQYLSDNEKIEMNLTYSNGYLLWTKIAYIILGIIFLFTIVLAFIPLMFIIRYYSLKSRRYIITDKRVLIIKGLINKSTKDIPYKKITDTQTKQDFLDKIFYNSGTIFLNTAGSHGYEAALEHVGTPFEIKKFIDKHIQ